MSKFTIGLSAVLGLIGTSALAADLPVKAPPPVFVDIWSGVYGGLNGGYGWGDVNIAPGVMDPASLVLLSQGVFPFDQVKQNGGFAGGQVGYNWLLSNRVWLVGVETDLQWSDIRGSAAFTRLTGEGGSIAFTTDVDRKLDWFGTLRARLGFLATPNLLLYGTGGLAYGETKTNANSLLTTSGASASINISSGNFTFACAVVSPAVTNCYGPGSNSHDAVGWVAGLGAEYHLDANWSVKFEWLYMDMGTSHVTLVSPSPPSTPGVFTSFDFTERYQLARVGFNYKFGVTSPVGVVAKY